MNLSTDFKPFQPVFDDSTWSNHEEPTHGLLYRSKNVHDDEKTAENFFRDIFAHLDTNRQEIYQSKTALQNSTLKTESVSRKTFMSVNPSSMIYS